MINIINNLYETILNKLWKFNIEMFKMIIITLPMLYIILIVVSFFNYKKGLMSKKELNDILLINIILKLKNTSFSDMLCIVYIISVDIIYNKLLNKKHI